ncbi:MAG: hypothetical protein JWO59_2209 [Chloroflexi bacterium]|nr:hypothetical protein [Chloroflexota bacterium]
MKFSITIETHPYLDNVYAELMADEENWANLTLEENWADVTHEEGVPRLEIYPTLSGDPWVFELDELLAHLLAAKRELVAAVEAQAGTPE